jgi:mannose-6-phosphate isomerase-like protein (cupin superfamily)
METIKDYVTNFHGKAIPTADKHGKASLFENEAMLVGLNCYAPGQETKKHAHKEQNRFYMVLEGSGEISLDDETRSLTKDEIFFVPNGHSHRVRNTGTGNFLLLVCIAPAHAD